MQLDKLFLNFGLAASVAEMVTLVLVLLVLSTIFWLLIGRFRLHNFLINMYISLALLSVIPSNVMSFSKNSSIILFLIFVILLTLMNKYLFDIHQSGSGMALWQVFLMSFFEVVLLLSIIFSFLPAKDVAKYVSKNSLSYFIDPWWSFAWMILPLAFLIFVKKRDR
ncbi:MAG: hypothetical protein US25_C0061G0005 [Candidatus Moranbacteria bacterium GW2011_GWE1_36_7]|nr:MAG: hypothetical protein UR99_C0037G0008 [Candidatus Moranbacteria bacterium GW2011_GWD2_36_12]KKQ05406.1 MAG: hypothetical protein US16_C0035G0007 [Candidatus Moranbacteria bacterium GW2011_GWE2_36_40]KKQ12165.1 MAG: hypothetical protein US25_C0061G0005 [Candidatus Moranbacteria bacterium GW2011_GWE1_36_7]